MSSAYSHPRRRAQNTLDTTQTCPQLPSLEPKQRQEAIKAMSLRKGSTFHSPKLPSSPVDDPVLDVRGVPLRSPTCPQSLEDLVAASETRIASLLENIDRSLAGQDTKGLEQTETFPVPRFLVAHASINSDVGKNVKKEPRTSNHASDSGLGTSVSSVSDTASDTDQRSTAERLRLAARPVRSRNSVYSPTRHGRVASESSTASSIAGDEQLFLSAHATKKIRQLIIDPILAEDRLKDYHKLVGGVPRRIGQRNITCLRDLEKTLIFLAPSKSKSAASYLQFCETSIQCIHTTVDHLNDQDQRRPTDRPYTNNYFLDLIQQVRQYARIMAVSKQKQAEGKPLGKDDYTPDEKLRLKGGMSEDGKPAELVREKDGVTISIDAEQMELDDEDDDDDDPERSMARKRKCDIGKEVWRACRECGKQFKRPCDLTKHEKTHSRPWKCPVENCKYHLLGWPTEKECDRHVNDKHTSTPALYHCLYEGCTYTSKRESNCKQHMEKTHGYDYVRSKSKKASRLMPTAQAQSPDAASSAMLTPSSAYQSIPSPGSNFTSPLMHQNNLSPPATDEGSPFSGAGTIATGSMSLFETNMDLMGQGNNFNNFEADQMQSLSHAVTPQGSAAHSEGMGTPNTNLTFSDIDPTLPDAAWNMQFDFGELANDDGFPTPEEFFNQYANGQTDPVQQPTPAMSDFDLSKSPDGPKSMTVAAQQHNPMLNQQDSLPSNALGGGDFSLFGEQGESSAMAHIFSDLTGNGGQFDNTFDLDADFKSGF